MLKGREPAEEKRQEKRPEGKTPGRIGGGGLVDGGRSGGGGGKLRATIFEVCRVRDNTVRLENPGFHVSRGGPIAQRSL